MKEKENLYLCIIVLKLNTSYKKHKQTNTTLHQVILTFKYESVIKRPMIFKQKDLFSGNFNFWTRYSRDGVQQMWASQYGDLIHAEGFSGNLWLSGWMWKVSILCQISSIGISGHQNPELHTAESYPDSLIGFYRVKFYLVTFPEGNNPVG